MRLSVLEATWEDIASVPPVRKWASQRTAADFRVKAIKADRELRRDASYTPSSPTCRSVSELAVPLDDREFSCCRSITVTTTVPGCATACSRGGEIDSCRRRGPRRTAVECGAKDKRPECSQAVDICVSTGLHIRPRSRS